MTTYPKHFRRPPAWFLGLNTVWHTTYPLGTKIRLDKDSLISGARKMTGLTDLGKDFTDEPLERLLWSVDHEADLHPVGRFITAERFKSLLAIRLRAEQYFRLFPQILDQELYPAWIIIGLQRTGTTKLHRLLATDPDHRVIPSWEVINPIPLDPPQAPPQRGRGDRRVKVAKMSVKAVKYMSPGFFAVHPIDAMQPEEDILLLDVSFMSTTPEAMMQVPSYASWLERTDQSSAYEYYVKLLKFLQWQHPARRWVLKTPHHLEFPHLIHKFFPRVQFLWPHRTLYESVPSFLSMVTYNHMMFSGRPDMQRITDHWVRKTGYMLSKALEFRRTDQHHRLFTDIYYLDLVNNSLRELEKIYRENGGLTPEQVDRFRKHEEEHPYRKHGVHQYSLADFGLTEHDIDQHTQHYQDFITTLHERD
jgi:hypothetical protein